MKRILRRALYITGKIFKTAWEIVLLALGAIGLVAYFIVGFFWDSLVHPMSAETRDPCERGTYEETLERNKKRIWEDPPGPLQCAAAFPDHLSSLHR